MYLSLVTDVYSKKIMRFNVSKSLHATGANAALEQGDYPKEPLIHHPDRGLQYCSDLYQETLNGDGIKCSMTEK